MLQVSASNTIHPTAVVDPSVKMGTGNYVGPYCVIGANVVIGNNNRIESHSAIGSAPEHKQFWDKEYASVTIGNNCVIREFTTINAGTTRNTQIGDHVHILRSAYVGHDCILHDHVNLSCNSILSGHCELFTGANLGIGVLVHQYSMIGHYCMIGMGCIVTKKSTIMPFNTYIGAPARLLKRNQYAIDKNKFDESFIKKCEQEFRARVKKPIAV